MLFQTEHAAIKPTKLIASVYDAMFLTSAAVGFGSALLFAGSLDKISKAALTTTGLAGMISYSINTKANERVRKFSKGVEEARLDTMKMVLDEEEELFRLKSEIERAKRKVELIENKAKPWEVGYWADQAKVLFGLEPMEFVGDQSIEQSDSVSGNQSIGIRTQSSFEDVQDSASEIDYTWIDDDFIRTSKGVFGARGSGKTTYLNYEALRFLQTYPDGELRIGDLHFDPDEPKWLPGVPSDLLLKSFVANKKDKIIDLIGYCNKELKDRIDKMDKKRRRIKLIIDEFIGLLGRCDDKEIKLIDSFLATVLDEGRKFGVDVTLGLHSLKKERCKIDSSVLWQMDILCLANSISDPTTKFPSDWENKQLSNERHAVQASLRKGQGFACVVCKNHAGEPARVAVLPHIDLSQFTLELDDQPAADVPQHRTLDQLESELMQWVQSVDELPSPDEVEEKWTSLGGPDLTPKQLNGLLNKLGLQK